MTNGSGPHHLSGAEKKAATRKGKAKAKKSKPASTPAVKTKDNGSSISRPSDS